VDLLPNLDSVQVSGLVTVPQAAAIMGVHDDTLYRWIRRGMVPAYGPPNCMRVRMAEVLEALRYKPAQRHRPALRRAGPLPTTDTRPG
jgi:excisionase family DNA binding protein